MEPMDISDSMLQHEALLNIDEGLLRPSNENFYANIADLHKPGDESYFCERFSNLFIEKEDFRKSPEKLYINTRFWNDSYISIKKHAPKSKQTEFLQNAVENCKSSVEIWLAYVDSKEPEERAEILNEAVKCIPHSIELWTAKIKYAKTESEKLICIKKSLKYNKNNITLWLSLLKMVTNEELKKTYETALLHNPGSIALWDARIHDESCDEERKLILKDAVLNCNKNENFWLLLAELEKDNEKKTELLFKALKNVPFSLKLWRETIANVSSPDEKRKLVRQAVEMNVADIDIFLEVFKTESGENTKYFLTEGCKRFPDHFTKLWNATVNEYFDNNEKIALLRKAIPFCKSNVEFWLALIELENNDSKKKTIMEALKQQPSSVKLWQKYSMLENLEPEERINILFEAVTHCNANIETWVEYSSLESGEKAQSIVFRGLKHYPNSSMLWREAINKETNHNCKIDILRQAVEHCNHNVKFWLDLANLVVENGEKIKILFEALNHIPSSMKLWEALELISNENEIKIYVANNAVKQFWSDLFTKKNFEDLINFSVEKLKDCPITPFSNEEQENDWDHLMNLFLKDDVWLALAKMESNEDIKVDLEKSLIFLLISLKSADFEMSDEMKEEKIILQSMFNCNIRDEISLNFDSLMNNKSNKKVTQFLIQVLPHLNHLPSNVNKTETEIDYKKREIYIRSLRKFITNPKVWQDLASKQKSNDTKYSVLCEALKHNPMPYVLWKNLIENSSSQKNKEECTRLALKFCKTAPEFWNDIANHSEGEDKKKILREAVENNPKNWKLIRSEIDSELNEDKKVELLREAIKLNFLNTNCWLSLIEQEKDLEKKMELINKSLEHVPTSVELWKNAIKRFPHNKLNFLRKAVMHCNKIEMFWLDLAELETIDLKKNILMNAISHVPNSIKLWQAVIANTASDDEKLPLLKQAAKNCYTCVEFWMSLAEYESKNSEKRKIYLEALTYVPDSEQLYLAAARSGNLEQAEEVLSSAVQFCPHNANLRLNLAKLKTGEEEKNIILSAVDSIPNAVKLWKFAAQFDGLSNEKKIKTLTEAVYYCPLSIGLWTDLINLKNGDERRETYLKAAENIPNHPKFWREAAKTVDKIDKIEAIRILKLGVKCCDPDEDLFSDLSNLLESYEKTTCLHQGLERLPHSEKLFLASFDNERSYEAKEKLLHKYLNHFIDDNGEFWMRLPEILNNFNKRDLIRGALKIDPTSTKLWRAAALFEHANSSKFAKILFQRAVEKCVTNVGPRLALARIESYENARNILLEANTVFPSDIEVLKAILKNEISKHGCMENLQEILAREVLSLSFNGIENSLDVWIETAMNAEMSGDIICLKAVINTIFGSIHSDYNLRKEGMNRIKECLRRNLYECARAIYASILEKLPNDKEIWVRAFFRSDSLYSNSEDLLSIKIIAKTFCSHDKALDYLIEAKESWNSENIPLAQYFITKAFMVDPSYRKFLESTYNKLIKCTFDEKFPMIHTNEKDIKKEPVESALIEPALNQWAKGHVKSALKTIEPLKYNRLTEYWIIKSQMTAVIKSYKEAADELRKAIDHVKDSTPLSLLLAELQVKIGSISKARIILESARIKEPNSIRLWLASIRLERIDENDGQTILMLSRALQRFPKSYELLAEQLFIENKTINRPIGPSVIQVLLECDNDRFIMLGVAKIYWSQNEIDKTRKWLEKVVSTHKNFGDAWAYLYKFEIEQDANDETLQMLRSRCAQENPQEGEEWCRFKSRLENIKLSTENVLIQLSTLIFI